jgi:PIN domain nuclease of toxin-antitoxin system
MGLILDTIIYADFIFNPERLTQIAQEKIGEEKDLFITSITVWELSNHIVKGTYNIGNSTLEEFVTGINSNFQIKILPLGWEVFNWITATPLIDTHGGKPHKDSFDRLIIAHSIVYNIPIISKDTHFPFYVPLGLNFIAV